MMSRNKLMAYVCLLSLVACVVVVIWGGVSLSQVNGNGGKSRDVPDSKVRGNITGASLAVHFGDCVASSTTWGKIVAPALVELRMGIPYTLELSWKPGGKARISHSDKIVVKSPSDKKDIVFDRDGKCSITIQSHGEGDGWVTIGAVDCENACCIATKTKG